MTTKQFETEWAAAFIESLGTVFAWHLIERAIRGELAAPVHGHPYALGWDPAKFVDSSAVIMLDITWVPWHVVVCETLEGRDYGRQLAHVVGLSRDYNDAFCMLDATGNEALFEQLVAADVPCEGVKFTNPAKQALIESTTTASLWGDAPRACTARRAANSAGAACVRGRSAIMGRNGREMPAAFSCASACARP